MGLQERPSPKRASNSWGLRQHRAWYNHLPTCRASTNPPLDALTFSRDMIEQHDHGQRHEGLGVLIDAAFDIAQWNAEHRPELTDARSICGSRPIPIYLSDLGFSRCQCVPTGPVTVNWRGY